MYVCSNPIYQYLYMYNVYLYFETRLVKGHIFKFNCSKYDVIQGCKTII